MLSFLKEGQLKPLGGEPEIPAVEAQEAAGGQGDYLTVAGHGKKLKQSTTLLIIVFAVGTAGVWMMIRKAAPSQAAAAAQKKNDIADITSAVAQLNGMQTEVSSQMKSVTTRLNHLSQVGQVGVEDLRKNPFVMDVVTKTADTSNPAQKQILEGQMRQRAAGFELWSISESPRGLSCMINDKVLYAGDQIEGFRIKEIRPKSVIVEQNDIQVELKID